MSSPALTDWTRERMLELELIVRQLLSSTALQFDERLRGLLPEEQGIYSISDKTAEPGQVLRAAKTRTAAGGLRQRVYGNHYMGNQTGNLCSQLIRQGVCKCMEETKPWIRANCVVQYAIVENNETRRWAEYMMLAVLRPKYCD